VLLSEILDACKETAIEQWVNAQSIEARELSWLRYHAVSALETQLAATIDSLTSAEVTDSE
jgi:hypothetical protein